MNAPAWWVAIVADSLSAGVAPEIVSANWWRGLVRAVANGLWRDMHPPTCPSSD